MSAAVRILWNALSEILSKHAIQILVVVDDPDQLFAETEHLHDVVGGLLTAATRISSRKFSEGVKGGIKVCVFVKQHKYDWLSGKFGDFDHIQRHAVALGWSEEEFDELIAERIRFREKLNQKTAMLDAWKRVFDVPTQESFLTMRSYLYSRLTNGPRDLIDFCNLAKGSAAEDGQARISRATFEAVEPQYSFGCLREIERQYGDRYQNLETVIRKLFEFQPLQTTEIMRRGELEERLRKAYASKEVEKLQGSVTWLAQKSVPEIIEIFFRAGLIGFVGRRGEDRVRIMSYSTHQIDDSIYNARELFIHPAYFAALGFTA